MKSRYVFLLCSALIIPSCTPIGLATGAGASLGVAAAQEGGISSAATDVRIRAQINDLWFRSNVNSFLKLGLTVDQGRVLVTGVVQNPEERVEAIRLAWQPEGVKQVINEVQVADSAGIVGYTRDSWITTRLRTAITFDRNIQSINYSIDTVKGVVYLIGTAQNQAELNRVIEKARTVPDVKRVVSYVKLAGKAISEPVTQGSQNAQYNAPAIATPTYSEDTNTNNFEPLPLNPDEVNYGTYDESTAVGGAPQTAVIESEPLD
jgi:osmotically-inducible protein OsmY